MNVNAPITAKQPFPSARGILQLARNRPLHHQAYRLRHPLAIYNLSVLNVLKRMRRVIEELHAAEKSRRYADRTNYSWGDDLLAAQDHLLDALMEHFDDCKSVLRCFGASVDDAEVRRASNAFNDGVRPYRVHVGTIVNSMKHNQRQIEWILFGRDFGFDPGYYVLGPDDHGVIGPDPNVHTDGATAFSFARDLRFHLCGLYFVGDHLADVLRRFGLSSGPQECPKEWSDLAFACLRGVALLPFRFFPDEVAMPVPNVMGGGNCEESEFRVQLPSGVSPQAVRGGPGLSLGQGDGVSLIYRLPYWRMLRHGQ